MRPTTPACATRAPDPPEVRAAGNARVNKVQSQKLCSGVLVEKHLSKFQQFVCPSSRQGSPFKRTKKEISVTNPVCFLNMAATDILNEGLVREKETPPTGLPLLASTHRPQKQKKPKGASFGSYQSHGCGSNKCTKMAPFQMTPKTKTCVTPAVSF